MTVQKGKDLLLKVDADGEGSFSTVLGVAAAISAIGCGWSGT
ncbi:MAG: hypothetical protein ACREDO_13070 [Methyloceanibacter sp.]